MDITTTDRGLLRLLQLSSVSLPVGGYAFSQGMEYAIDRGWIKNQAQVEDWTSLQLMQSFARVDLPILRMAMSAWQRRDEARLVALNDLVLACRETKELRLNDTAMGEALARLLRSLDVEVPFLKIEEVSFTILFAIAATDWSIEFETSALGFTWSWLENQIAAATKLVPLGQTQAQILFGSLQPVLTEAIQLSKMLDEDDVGAGLPAVAIASCLHETQYSRLFRS
ncbi:urease accessory protein UreF [Marinomonas mediterranea]|uniref:urease accessory protein UreF n=1 Tax=Marinomonas mediterranea TaxID=119864 RepID=UPI00234BC80B|nr:urease accessory UreF family protein [Marinomonas mediterranea]WCN07526.1 urease accessory protein UreF [Marinomonas mediterranea]